MVFTDIVTYTGSLLRQWATLSMTWGTAISIFVALFAIALTLFFAGGGFGIKANRTVRGKRCEPTGGWRNANHLDALVRRPVPEIRTLCDILPYAANTFGADRECLGYRTVISEERSVDEATGKEVIQLELSEYNWYSVREVVEMVKASGSGLRELGLQPGNHVGIFCQTSADWTIWAHGCFNHALTLVSIYATLSDEMIASTLNEAEVAVLITDAEALPTIARTLKNVHHISAIIYNGKADESVLSQFEGRCPVYKTEEVRDMGRKKYHEEIVCQPEDLALIMYTSGTTGKPKGVMITHGNLVAGIAGVGTNLREARSSHRYIGYLPLAHVLELLSETYVLSIGGCIGFGSPTTLTDLSPKIKPGTKGDATALRPTSMTAVPIIMDRLKKNVLEEVNTSAISRMLFNYAYKTKLARLKKSQRYFAVRWQDLLFRKARNVLGGRVRFLLSGGAPLSADTQDFMTVVFNAPIAQGYGMTETVGCGTITHVYDYEVGVVGGPLGCSEIKLVDWEEGGYFVNNKNNGDGLGQGEIVIGGPNVSPGYYKDEERTAESFYTDKDGVRWFRTGDIGQFRPNGVLQVVDRIKDLVKLQNGEYVALSKAESMVQQSAYVETACVYADSNQSYAVALVVPIEREVTKWATNQGLEMPWPELVSHPDVVSEVVRHITEVCKAGQLVHYEIPKKIKLCPDPWTSETGLLTPTNKFRRSAIKQYYQTELNAMYQ